MPFHRRLRVDHHAQVCVCDRIWDKVERCFEHYLNNLGIHYPPPPKYLYTYYENVVGNPSPDSSLTLILTTIVMVENGSGGEMIGDETACCEKLKVYMCLLLDLVANSPRADK